jgi:exodeoxyribonuclease V beta subunit
LEGRTLIEAGAGTGKTYTLAGLVLRLIVEQGLGIEQILVVTYTKAATEELKTRIRSRLSAARHAFQGRPAEDDSLARLVERSPDARAARRRLADALTNFDRAAIFTIHGFCQRLLQNFAFETGHLFQSQLQQDRDPLVQEMVADFWRRYVTHAPYELARYILLQLKGPEQLGRIIAYCAYPDIKVLPEGIKPALSAVAPWRKAAEGLQRQWAQSGDSVVHLLKDPGLNARSYGKCEPDPEQPPYTHRQLKLMGWSAYLDQWNGKYPLDEKRVKYLGASLLKKYTKKGHATPAHPFFDTCDQALDAQERMEGQLARYLRYLKIRLLQQARTALDRKKRRKNILFFDDLLLHIHSALKGAHGAALIQAIRRQYRVALVDEFQDTDPVQCEIFQRLFDRDPMILFMIGDPKQAIYSFRGADLFSYLKAADTADRSATLTRNWRSTPSLVQAVNALFEGHTRPFGYEQIRYHSATAARQEAAPVPVPLTLWYLTRTQGEAPSKPISQEDATQAIAAAVAEEVVRLLNAPQEKIEPWQIAVLTRTHRQSQIIKGALSGRRVPAVLHSAGSVFDTRQADALQRVLEAAADPHDPRKVRAALAQDMFGLRAADFHEGMEGESTRWQERWANLYHDHRIWLRRGVYAMLRALMAREKVRSHLLSLPDGERTLTNVLHLAELLHQAEKEHGLGPEGVVKWLADQRQSAQQDDEKQLRLESDADAVRIITMHKSKGLQFDVVFCPFTWSPIRTDKAAAVFHDASDEERWTLRLGPDIPPEDQLQAGKELLAENLRMLYVALTRARERCYLAWGRINGTELSAPAYLIHGTQTPAHHGDWLAPLSKKMKALADAPFIAELDHLSRHSKGTIRISPLPLPTRQLFYPPEKARKPGHRRSLRRMIDGHRPMASFSSLTAGTHDADGGLADRHGSVGDASSDIGRGESGAVGGGGDTFDALFGFPKGARAGLFFHDLLEHWDHTGGPPDRQEALIRSKLQVHGFDARWHPAVDRFLHQLSAKRLSGSGSAFCLSEVKMAQRINEMEFYFPLMQFSAEQIKECFKKYGDAQWRDAVGPRLERIRFAPQHGFMRGFADTVFQFGEQYFLLDWKSNHLGHKAASYDPPALDKCMLEEDYFLQYHLYTIALNRLLAQKIPGYHYERHFGGVFYIFLRGITADPADNSGLYFAKPDALLISALDDLMIAEAH